MEYIIIGLIILMALALYADYSLTYKKSKNERTSPNKKEQKLLRFQRGNKTLTREQQERLNMLNDYHHRTLKQIWKDEHL